MQLLCKFTQKAQRTLGRTLERTLAYTGTYTGVHWKTRRVWPRRPECERARADAAPLISSVKDASRVALDAISQNAGGLARAPTRRVHAPRYMYIHAYLHMRNLCTNVYMRLCLVGSFSSKAAPCKRLKATAVGQKFAPLLKTSTHGLVLCWHPPCPQGSILIATCH